MLFCACVRDDLCGVDVRSVQGLSCELTDIDRIAPYDEFIANLWQVHVTCQKEGYAQKLSLGLFRSDYMIHQEQGQDRRASLKQVEFNTIASSFGGLASKVSDLHRFLRDQGAYPGDVASILTPSSLPDNPSIHGLSRGLVAAHEAYGRAKTGRKTCVVMIVQDPERNTFDQKHIEYAVQQQGVAIFRLPFARVLSDTTIDKSSRALLYTPPAFPQRTYEVTTVYYRAGYSPAEYEIYYSSFERPFETQGWQSRLHLERSAAIKCPTVLTHLAGSKKVQQILALPGSDLLEHFLTSQSDVPGLRGTFMPIHPLDESSAGQEGRRLALDSSSAQRFVLKPQREGGGNNIYRSKICDFLKGQDEKGWAQYILMEMIETPVQKNLILRNGEVMEGGVICELGCYGAVLWNGEGKDLQIKYNEEAGTLLRTKGDQSEEGGVAAGFGAVYSPCLVDV